MDPGASRKLSWLIAAGCLCGAGLALVSVLVRAQNQPGVRLTGYVTDVTTRAPVAGAYLYIADQTGKQVGDASTNAGGYYEAAVPALKAYSVGVTVWVANGDYQVHRYVPITVVINRGDASAVRSDVALQPGASLILNMYDANGQILRNGGVGALTGGQLWVSDGRAYVTDLEDNSCDGLPFAVQDSYAYGRGWDAAIPAFVIPPGTRARIHVLWEVPGFGRILLDADNGGAGYQVAQQGGFVILNFPYEAAKFAVASLRADSASYSAKGYTIPSSAWSGLQSASGHLTTAEQYLARKPQAMTEAVAELNIALKEALWSHEELILEVARSDIQRNRTGTALVRVQDERGQALAGATVVFRQTNRGFLFGANPLGYNMRLNPLQVSLLREAGINHSYVSFPWEDIEPSPGAFRWDPIDAWQDMYGQLNQGFSLLGGMALWMYRGSGLGTKFCPAYQDNMSFPELQRNVREHMRAMAARYKGKIDLWSIDEQNMPWSNVLNLTWDQKIELYRTAIAGMREGNADAKTMFLAPALPYEFHPGKLHDTSARAGHVTFPEFLKLILARGIPVDVIALEAYYAGVNTDGYAPPGLSLVQFSKLLDQYSTFGKPIFFREFIAPSVQHPRSTWWHRPWDEATQAEFAKAVYTIAFSKSLVRQIGWSFGISDDNTFIVGGGLLDKTWNPKPVYFALKELLKSWTPSGEGRTSANGTFLLSGYAGDYDLTITASGRGTWQAHATLREQQQPAALTTAPEPTGPAPVVLSADVASYQERRDGSWFSEDIAGLPRSQSAPDVVFNVKDSVLKNRKNGQISPTLLASYWFIQSPASITDLKVHLHTARALFLRSGLLRFVDYLNNKVWLGDNTSGTIPVDVLETVKLCNENRVPIFLEVNYSDYIPGPTGTTGVGSLVHSDNIANTISFLELLQARSLHVDGITFGDQIGDDNGWGGYKPTVFNSDIASRFIRYASAIKSKFPRIKIYAFETTLGAVYGLLSPSLWNLDADHSCWPLLETVRQAEIGSGTPLIDGFSFTESYVYIDKDGNLLDSQHILDDTESLYRYAPIYRYAIMGESYPRTDPAYLPYIINRITGIFNRPLDFALTEYLPAGPLQISESDTSRYSDMDFILHFSDVVGISAMLGSEVVSRMIFAGSTDQAKCYVDNRGNRGINYPVQEQLATYFEGELLAVDRTVDYDALKVKLYATRKGGRYFLMILNKEVRREATLRITVPAGSASSPGATLQGWDMTVRVPRRSYVSLVIENGKVIVSGIGGGADPVISPGGVVNAASGIAGGVAPGEFVAIYGSHIGPSPSVSSSSMSKGLGGTRVFFNGIEAFTTYVSSNQVNALVPYGADGSKSANLEIAYGPMRSQSVALPIVESVPGIFTRDSSGEGAAVVVNQDGSLNGPDTPAAPHDIIAFWATGQGQTVPPGVDGKPPEAPMFPKPRLPVTVTIGGVPVPTEDMVFAGMVYPGVMQVNARIPGQVPSGAAELLLRIGNASSRGGVTVAVK